MNRPGVEGAPAARRAGAPRRPRGRRTPPDRGATTGRAIGRRRRGARGGGGAAGIGLRRHDPPPPGAPRASRCAAPRARAGPPGAGLRVAPAAPAQATFERAGTEVTTPAGARPRRAGRAGRARPPHSQPRGRPRRPATTNPATPAAARASRPPGSHAPPRGQRASTAGRRPLPAPARRSASASAGIAWAVVSGRSLVITSQASARARILAPSGLSSAWRPSGYPVPSHRSWCPRPRRTCSGLNPRRRCARPAPHAPDLGARPVQAGAGRTGSHRAPRSCRRRAPGPPRAAGPPARATSPAPRRSRRRVADPLGAPRVEGTFASTTRASSRTLTRACWRSSRSACSRADRASGLRGVAPTRRARGAWPSRGPRPPGGRARRRPRRAPGRRRRPRRHAPDGREVGRRDRRRTLGGAQGLLPVGVGQEHRELLAADARDQLAGAGLLAQHAGGALQHPVARLVAVVSFDPLEVVEVHQHQGHPAPAPRPATSAASRSWKVRWLASPVRGSTAAISSAAARLSRVCVSSRSRRYVAERDDGAASGPPRQSAWW